MNIGDRIKSMRIKMNLTQDELAASIKSTKQTIHKYENGIISNIPAGKIKIIAEKLQTTPSYLMGWDEDTEICSDKESPPEITESEKTMLQKFRELAPDDQKYIAGLIDRFHETIDAVIIKENIKKTD